MPDCRLARCVARHVRVAPGFCEAAGLVALDGRFVHARDAARRHRRHGRAGHRRGPRVRARCIFPDKALLVQDDVRRMAIAVRFGPRACERARHRPWLPQLSRLVVLRRAVDRLRPLDEDRSCRVRRSIRERTLRRRAVFKGGRRRIPPRHLAARRADTRRPWAVTRIPRVPDHSQNRRERVGGFHGLRV